tara:strand:+ start:158 stop:475 length:318 start_codon:yes stop_codon:yes gene_type:complete
MTDERRLKTEAERELDRKALDLAQARLNGAVATFFSNVQDYGTYGEVGVRHYDRMYDTYQRLTGPLERIKQAFVAKDTYGLPDVQKPETSNLYFYTNDSLRSELE